jgi:carbamoyl-phosphate synthase large subunit
VQAVVPKEIISKVGVTRIAVTRRNVKIDAICRRIQKKLKANGPFNVQLVLDTQTNEPYPFEINPRFSTSTTLTLAGGIDELGGLVTQAIFGSKSFQFPDSWEEGVVLIRGTLDSFIDEKTYK